MHRKALVMTALLGLLAGTANATWSIVMVDSRTGEIAIGSATCLTNFDLKRGSPVVRVGVGAAAAQSSVDSTGANRQLIYAELGNGTDPQQILTLLRENEGRQAHNSRQYGIVDVRGRAVTFSGNRNGAFAGGRVGQVGTLHYAVQGNVITGMEVVDAAADAVENTPGDLPEKLMAAMEAAYCYGGDGRCSCDQPSPDGCGAPPKGFTCDGDLTQNPKSAHIGYIIVARRGDTDGACNASRGCADGTYFLSRNVRNAQASDPDPVFTLRERFDIWRANRTGRPDQVQSLVTLSDDRVLPGTATPITMRIELHDYAGQTAVGVENVEVLHDPDGSAAGALIGPVTLLDADQQVYECAVVSGDTLGIDQLAVRVTYDGGQQFYLMPGGRIAVQDPRGDFNADGRVDAADLALLLANYGSVGGTGDFDGNGRTDLSDLASLLIVPGLNW